MNKALDQFEEYWEIEVKKIPKSQKRVVKQLYKDIWITGYDWGYQQSQKDNVEREYKNKLYGI